MVSMRKQYSFGSCLCAYSNIHELSLSPSLLSLQQTKVYQHSCHNTAEAHNKLVKCKEKVDGSRGAARKKKAQEKELEVGDMFSQSVWTGLCPPTALHCIHELAGTGHNFVCSALTLFVV